jgi:ribosomal protein S18 acetylase RimI-like enzyme
MITLSNINFRKAIPEDAAKLSLLFKQVYIHNYAFEGVSDEYANFLVDHFSLDNIGNTIREERCSIVVAEYRNSLIGAVKLSYSQNCPYKDIVAPELDKLYVLERFCGMGIGSRLLEKAEKLAIAKGDKYVWVYVWQHNPRAIRFYTKKGFENLGAVAYRMEVNTYYNLVMLKKLSPGD